MNKYGCGAITQLLSGCRSGHFPNWLPRKTSLSLGERDVLSKCAAENDCFTCVMLCKYYVANVGKHLPKKESYLSTKSNIAFHSQTNSI